MPHAARRRAAARLGGPSSRATHRGGRPTPDRDRTGGSRERAPAALVGSARAGARAFLEDDEDDEDDEDVEVVPAPTSGSLAEASLALATERPAWLHPVAVLTCSAVIGLGAVLLVAAVLGLGPTWLDGVGAVAVVTAYSWALAARTGGRPIAAGALALVLGVAALAIDQDIPRTGAAVLTCVVSAVLAVMLTRPAVRLRNAAAECSLAVGIAAVGALATVGFDPVISVERFEYVTLGLAVVCAFGVVHRLGAGLHGLGRRGVGAVLLGGLLLAATVLYAELLRRYGPPDVVDRLLDGVRWSRHHLGAFPRPIETVLGVPALTWGCHMRARRRQGWWLCAFGVAATTPVANCLINPVVSLLECALSVGYGLVVGLAIGAVAIRLDLALTGSRDRGARRMEESTAVRPEPPRTEALM